jgi:oxygen-independent coproporphyrinogen-3 oxidase
VVTRPEQLALLARAGFNRLSMGVQDFDPAVQRAVNRIQSVEETRAMVVEARALGFQSVNFDLIYGLPRQTPDSWQRTLEQVVALRPDRIAAFSFAYVPEAKPHQRRLPAADIPHGRAKLELFLLAHRTLAGAGYRAIGMDHFALEGDELARAQDRGELWRDFQGYTTQRATDTVAFGVTGISDVGGAYAQSIRSLHDYEQRVTADRLPTVRGLELTADDLTRRRLITELMCNFRVDLGDGAATSFAAELPALRALERDGLIHLRGTRIDVTPLGRLFVRNVAMALDAHLAQPRDDKRLFSRTV